MDCDQFCAIVAIPALHVSGASQAAARAWLVRASRACAGLPVRRMAGAGAAPAVVCCVVDVAAEADAPAPPSARAASVRPTARAALTSRPSRAGCHEDLSLIHI